MSNREKAERILEAVDMVYTIPTYFWDRVGQEILAELNNIDEEERKKVYEQ